MLVFKSLFQKATSILKFIVEQSKQMFYNLIC